MILQVATTIRGDGRYTRKIQKWFYALLKLEFSVKLLILVNIHMKIRSFHGKIRLVFIKYWPIFTFLVGIIKFLEKKCHRDFHFFTWSIHLLGLSKISIKPILKIEGGEISFFNQKGGLTKYLPLFLFCPRMVTTL